VGAGELLGDGAERAAGEAGDLGDVVALEIAEHHDGALVLGQAVEGGQHVLVDGVEAAAGLPLIA
jgi:hypothetical protein